MKPSPTETAICAEVTSARNVLPWKASPTLNCGAGAGAGDNVGDVFVSTATGVTVEPDLPFNTATATINASAATAPAVSQVLPLPAGGPCVATLPGSGLAPANARMPPTRARIMQIATTVPP